MSVAIGIGTMLGYWSLLCCDRLYKHGLALIPARISNHMSSKVWENITYPFPNFNRWSMEMDK